MREVATVALNGRRVVVTGGARGLGASFVAALAEAGARVVFGDLLHDDGEALANSLRAAGHDVSYRPLDLAQPASVASFVDAAAAALGGLDGLVNNAAITNSGGQSATELTPATWDAVMTVNVRGTWLASTAALPHLRESGRGAIVNIASDTALWGAPKLLAYVASKGAMIAMTHSLAREFGEHGVTVNAIAPGLTEVEATAYVPQARHDYYREGRALQRAQVPADVTGPVLFLLSDAARFVTGQLLPVNGGFVMN
ncbi:SDR family oxidoreductase [Paraburkholderia caballeronis]|uniref:NAD(P)-dependent dehydrogenase, short-chain alcohol dehydrogenase family n=1 Tax=Paraburkholderia caballeronis TaxID=416943 RepID=A0A1H7LBT3_9BURK|nr:SDR family oxidoreductase [Paraburkholderia caballeronis]PXW28389.1 NAD(P)-dependent dehydrogenase (short-subunit alcohol dehydrogenase family) [Paraburkholderia caballeronis]PXX03755.1 NAD(P)-dependent dehydrogenase (short-subunit alcohol dehydrogenase family) [Paraburkholderia caballeronis]RAK04499.1 NAD(P)-dependent dehydrogenase (short-subunit alcohol dehydrogenase family) [Paraburkholderia caballeronis]SED77680.1 NAD(P)-dependent dehydrogenase, short-chain alcohol dehydrogenase family [